MKYKYNLLNSGRGIVIFLEMEELFDFQHIPSDAIIADEFFLRIRDNVLPKDIYPQFVNWIIKGFQSVIGSIRKERKSIRVCFYISSLEFHPAHFQEEGLYYMIQGWMSQYYGFDIPLAKFEYDGLNNRYKFFIPPEI